MKHKKAELIRAEKYQAAYFGYGSLGLLAWFIPSALLRSYMERRFFEQLEKDRCRFERMTVHNRRRRERMIKKVASAK